MAAQCDIAQAQNAPTQLQRLAAQRRLYSRAKRLFTATTIASLAVPAIAFALAAVYPSLRPWAALYGIAVVVLDLTILDAAQKRDQRTAADIQEAFDCDVLRIDVNKLKVPHSVDPETVTEMADQYRRCDQDLAKLKNWYPEAVAALPLPLARLVCQRTNARWDASLRRSYARALLLVAVLGCLLTLGAGLLFRLSLDAFALAVAALALPSIVWGMKQWRQQRQAADDADRIRRHIESLWEKALSSVRGLPAMECDSRQIQDEIYERRRRDPVVFDFVYERLRARHQSLSDLSAEQLVHAAQDRLRASSAASKD